jgi:YegS/Rv2252/BmrU family lipid kinase
MRKAAILYNPLSGGHRDRRLADVDAALAVLRASHVEAIAEPTRPNGEAADQARAAIAQGCDAILACGGDGTVHDVLQGIVGSEAALGIIPLGTANALAHDLKLPRDPAAATLATVSAQARRVTVGQVNYLAFDGKNMTRYFIVAAGIGVDAHLFYQLNVGLKQRLGMFSYYAKATHLWLTHPLKRFITEYLESGATEPKRAIVSELLAVRIRYFGGVLQELAPGASLDRKDVRLVLFRTTSRLSYLLYIIRGLLGERFPVPGVDLVNGERVSCHYLSTSTPKNGSPRANPRIYVEVDGELVGTLPAEITLAPETVNLLVP